MGTSDTYCLKDRKGAVCKGLVLLLSWDVSIQFELVTVLTTKCWCRDINRVTHAKLKELCHDMNDHD